MKKKAPKFKMTELDLSRYSAEFVDLINEHMPEDHQVGSNDTIAMGPGARAVEIRSTVTTQEGDNVTESEQSVLVTIHDKDAQKYLSGYITLSYVLRNALSTYSWQFIEWFLVTYGVAFNEGALKLGEILSEDFILDNIGKEGMIGIRREFITRWVDKGIVCKTDIAIREELLPCAADERRKTALPINYPIVIVGGTIFFNQACPTPYMTVKRMSDGDPLGPKVANAIIYESLGLAVIEQRGPEVTFTYRGEEYFADPLGVREAAFV